MQFFDSFLTCYGWEGAALAGVILAMLCVQFGYYIFAYGRIPDYKNNRRTRVRDAEQPISIVIPMFSEDYTFVEERLPLLLAQKYPVFELVLVYVGQNNDFYEDLYQLKKHFPQITTTKILLDPRYPISRKQALNVGIKSAHYECMILSSTDVCPQSDRWLSLMAKGFERGDVVVGYCGIEHKKGVANYLMRTWRMMLSVNWITRAIQQRPYRGILHSLGFTKTLYFGVNGFNYLNMNIGEDDLFLQQIMTRENVSVILSPRATLHEKCWGGMDWWLNQQRYYGATAHFYPAGVRNFIGWELLSRVLFFATTLCAITVMPLEYKIGAAVLLLLRYIVVVVEVKRIARRLGEIGIAGRYFLYDLIGPLGLLWVRITLLHRDERVWR